MKRYILFAGENYSEQVGVSGFQGFYHSKSDAIYHGEEYLKQNYSVWYQVCVIENDDMKLIHENSN